MAEMTHCARHPKVETGLSCVTCDTPICPSCAKDAVIGLRCPDCAKPPKNAGLRRKPDQVAKAATMAVGGALAGALVIALFDRYIGFFTLLLTFFVAVQIAQRVRAAAGGNNVDVIRYLALGGAIGAAVLSEVIYGLLFFGGIPQPGFYTLLRVGIAGYGAYNTMR